MCRSQCRRRGGFPFLVLLVPMAVALGWGPFHRSEAPAPAAVEAAQEGEVLLNQRFTVAAGGQLSVDLASEDVVVETGSGTEATVRIYGEGRNARQAFERRRYRVRQDGSTLRIESDPQRGTWNFMNNDNSRFTVVVRIPARFNANFDLSSGDIRLGDLEGDVSVDVSSGDFQAGRIRGDLHVDASSGNTQVEAVDGNVLIDVSSGDARIRRVRGERLVFDSSSGSLRVEQADVDELSTDTSSGDIEVGGLIGRVEASSSSGSQVVGNVGTLAVMETTSGSIRLHLSKDIEVRASASSGDITVFAPSSLRASLQANGGSIRIDDTFAFGGRIENRSARGPINGGGPDLRLTTSSGTVELKAE